MKAQTSKDYNVIGRYGCYFAALLHEAEQISGKALNPAVVIRILAESICSGLIDMMPKRMLYILKPGKVCSLALYELNRNTKTKVLYTGYWNADMQEDEKTNKEGCFWGDDNYDFAILRYRTKYGYHFTSEGYNPDLSLELQRLNGKRFFKVTRGN